MGSIPGLERIQAIKPQLGLLVARNSDSPLAQSLVAEVQSVEGLLTDAEAQAPTEDDRPTDLIAIELSFPAVLDRQQQGKIKQLLRSLD